MFYDTAGYLDFLHSVRLDFSGAAETLPGGNEAVVAVGKSAAFMYEKFLEFRHEMAQLPVFIAAPQGSDTFGIPKERIVFSTHPHITQKSFEAAERLLEFLTRLRPWRVYVLLSGGSSALLEKSSDPETTVKINDRLLKSGLPITEMNRIRIENSLIKGGRLAAAFPGTDWRVFVMSDIPFERGERLVGSMPFYREDLENTSLFVTADSDSLHDALLSMLPRETLSIRRFTGSVGELVQILRHSAENSVPCTLVTGEPLLAIARGAGGIGGRMSHLTLSFYKYLPENAELFALSSDGIDGSSPYAGAIISEKKRIPEEKIAKAVEEFDSAPLLNEYGFELRSGATGINLNDFVILRLKN
ncbi:DUF4147 domain-containing protein [bacterium]|nr:DUF4147 domain-containing protein [bacterium]